MKLRFKSIADCRLKIENSKSKISNGMVEMNTIQKIPLQQIDLSDETFSINYLPDLQRLKSSIEEMGLIQPVILREKQNKYRIVCGFRRISIIQEFGKSAIESRVFGEEEKDDFTLFSLSLHENLTTRGFNTVEKAMALDKLVHYFQISPVIVMKTFLPLFSLEPNEKILNTYLSLARMEDDVKRYILKEEVSRSNIRILSTLTPHNRTVLLSLLSSMKLGENQLREMLTLLEEISRRDRIRVIDVVQRPEIQAVLLQKDLTPSQRTERVKKELMILRYPRMDEMEKDFEKKRRGLNLPFGVLLHHEPFFEGRGLKIEFQFETLEEYQSILASLSKIPDKKEFQEMIEI